MLNIYLAGEVLNGRRLQPRLKDLVIAEVVAALEIQHPTIIRTGSEGRPAPSRVGASACMMRINIAQTQYLSQKFIIPPKCPLWIQSDVPYAA